MMDRKAVKAEAKGILGRARMSPYVTTLLVLGTGFLLSRLTDWVQPLNSAFWKTQRFLISCTIWEKNTKKATKRKSIYFMKNLLKKPKKGHLKYSRRH